MFLIVNILMLLFTKTNKIRILSVLVCLKIIKFSEKKIRYFKSEQLINELKVPNVVKKN